MVIPLWYCLPPFYKGAVFMYCLAFQRSCSSYSTKLGSITISIFQGVGFSFTAVYHRAIPFNDRTGVRNKSPRTVNKSLWILHITVNNYFSIRTCTVIEWNSPYSINFVYWASNGSTTLRLSIRPSFFGLS